MNATKKVFSNIIYLLLDWIFITLFSFLFWFIMAKTLLPDQYGIVITTFYFMTLLSTISFLGFERALNKLIPELRQGRKFLQITDLIRFSSKIILASNSIIVILLFLFSSPLASYINVPIDAFFIGIFILFSMSASSLFGAILYGYQNMRKIFYTDAIGFALKLVVGLTFAFTGLKYSGALIAILAAYFVIAITRINFEWFKGKGNNLDKKTVVHDYAISAFISSLAILILSGTQTTLLSVFQGVSVAGIFGIAMTLTLPIFSIPNILSIGLFPITSQLSANKNSKSQQVHLISIVLRYSLFITLPLILFLIFFSNTLILLFSRSEYLSASPLFLPLSIGALLFAISSLFTSSIYAIKKPKLQRNILVFSASIFLLLAIPFTIYFSSIGLAYSYLLATLLKASLGFYFLKRNLDLKLPLYDIVKIVAGLLGLFFVLILTDVLGISLFFKFVLAGLGIFFYLIILFALRFYKKMDIVILQYVKESVPRTKSIIDFLIKILSKNISKD